MEENRELRKKERERERESEREKERERDYTTNLFSNSYYFVCACT